jgi:hypothetical protein
MPWNKTDRSFKTLIHKRVTDSDAKFYFNEKGDFTINTHQLELWVDSIPNPAPGSTTDIVQYYNTLTLVEDTSVPNKQTWFATSNSSTVPAQTDEVSRLKNWVSDKYGSSYEVLLYDTSDVQIPPSDGCGWFFDYQTGILTFSSATTTTGGGGTLSSRAPFKIRGYRYIGRTGLDGNIIKNEVRVATTPSTSFSGWSYSSELIDTGVTSASLSIDGISLNIIEGLSGDRILIKDWSTLSNNGIYYVERAGDGASDTWRFRRSPDFNDSEDIFPSTMVFTRSGTVNARTVWSMSNASFTTLDAGGATGEITFSQFGTVSSSWSSITVPTTNLSLGMSTNTTAFNWATGTSTNNLFSLTTDASANGTGVLLNINTGASSTVVPFRVRRDSTDYLTVNATGGVLVGNLTSGRITYAGTSGLLSDSSAMTFNGNRIALSTTGSTGGLLIGGDANLYRSAADVLATDDHFNLNTSDREVRLTTSNATAGGIVFNTSTKVSAYQDQGFVFTTPTSGTAAATINGGSFRREVDVAGAFTGTLNGLTINSQFNDGFTAGFTSTGTVNGAYIASYTSSFSGTGGTLAKLTGVKIDSVHYDDSNTGAGISVVNQYGAEISVTNSGNGGIITNSAGVLIANTSEYTANSQTRYGIFIDSMPDPGSFTSTTTAAIRLTGTGGARDGILFGSDTNLYRSTSNTLRTDDAFIAGNGLTVSANGAAITGAITGTTSLTLGVASGTTGSILLVGTTSGTITIQPQAAAGTYNFNLPTTAGTSGYVLTSAGGGSSPMTWTDPASLGGSTWNALTNPNGNESLSMTTYTTVFNWATGTSTNNLFSLTTDASANGTGVLLNINTGASSTVIPFKVGRSSTDYLTVNATGGVLIGNLTSGRITYAGTSGLLSDAATMTFDGNRVALSTTGNTGGLLIGGDANLYRSAADVLATDDHFNLNTSDRELRLTTSSATLGGIVLNTSQRISSSLSQGFVFGNAVSGATSGFINGGTFSRELDPSSAFSGNINALVAQAQIDDYASGGSTHSGNVYGANISALTSSFNAGGSLSRLSGIRIASTHYDDSGAGSGLTVTTQYGAEVYVDNSGNGGVVTASAGVYIQNASEYTANSQSRYGLMVDGMPDPGGFTSTITSAILLSGTGGARDGILFSTDTNLYRSTSNALRTDDSFIIGTNLTVNSLTSGRVPFASTSGLLIDSSAFTFTTGTGQLALSTTGSGGGILIGGDANLYRSATNILKTDDAFEAASFNKVAITAPATSATLTITDGSTLTVSASATISGTNTGDNAVNSLYSGLVSNATHTGEVTGATTLTVDKTAITNKSNVTAATSDKILIADASDSDNLKHVTAQSIVDLVPYIRRSINVVSSPTTAGATANTDYVYLVSGTTTITLPTAVGNTNMYTIKRTGTNTVTIDTTSSQTIDGLTSQTLLTQYESMSFISDNSNWSII